MRTLIAEHFAPWSEKARWALDHHGLAYSYREHVPLLGELLLRLRTRRPTGRVSTPALVTPHGVLTDSFAIARHADQIGRGPTLFPPDHDAAITAWNARSETALAAGRALYLERLTHDRAAKVEMQPPFLPAPVRRASVPAADLAIVFLRRKYGIDAAALAVADATLARELDGLREALAGDRAYLLGEGLTYADMAMAVTLQFVAPVDTRYIALSPAARAPWWHAALAERYADLVAWRDALYDRHRRARPAPAGAR
ncbi:glutathione S-transferase family protein [Sorangium sp. So ce128]|uniref:glutathione S-transferase family protein n=1 Tax=Sorangium sp. So ce128 TaxID=3133281 RepID=UPI003F61856D